jgi:hypothetical protein
MKGGNAKHGVALDVSPMATSGGGRGVFKEDGTLELLLCRATGVCQVYWVEERKRRFHAEVPQTPSTKAALNRAIPNVTTDNTVPDVRVQGRGAQLGVLSTNTACEHMCKGCAMSVQMPRVCLGSGLTLPGKEDGGRSSPPPAS